MSLIKGNDFVLKLNSTTLGQSKSASINMSTDLPNASNKDSQGWRDVIPGTRETVLFADALAGATSMNFENLVAFYVNKTLVSFTFEYQNQRYAGSGYIKSVEQVATFEDVNAFDLEIESTGIVTFSAGSVTQIEFVTGGNIEFVEGGDIDFVALS